MSYIDAIVDQLSATVSGEKSAANLKQSASHSSSHDEHANNGDSNELRALRRQCEQQAQELLICQRRILHLSAALSSFQRSPNLHHESNALMSPFVGRSEHYCSASINHRSKSQSALKNQHNHFDSFVVNSCADSPQEQHEQFCYTESSLAHQSPSATFSDTFLSTQQSLQQFRQTFKSMTTAAVVAMCQVGTSRHNAKLLSKKDGKVQSTASATFEASPSTLQATQKINIHNQEDLPPVPLSTQQTGRGTGVSLHSFHQMKFVQRISSLCLPSSMLEAAINTFPPCDPNSNQTPFSPHPFLCNKRSPISIRMSPRNNADFDCRSNCSSHAKQTGCSSASQNKKESVAAEQHSEELSVPVGDEQWQHEQQKIIHVLEAEVQRLRDGLSKQQQQYCSRVQHLLKEHESLNRQICACQDELSRLYPEHKQVVKFLQHRCQMDSTLEQRLKQKQLQFYAKRDLAAQHKDRSPETRLDMTAVDDREPAPTEGVSWSSSTPHGNRLTSRPGLHMPHLQLQSLSPDPELSDIFEETLRIVLENIQDCRAVCTEPSTFVFNVFIPSAASQTLPSLVLQNSSENEKKHLATLSPMRTNRKTTLISPRLHDASFSSSLLSEIPITESVPKSGRTTETKKLHQGNTSVTKRKPSQAAKMESATSKGRGSPEPAQQTTVINGNTRGDENNKIDVVRKDENRKDNDVTFAMQDSTFIACSSSSQHTAPRDTVPAASDVQHQELVQRVLKSHLMCRTAMCHKSKLKKMSSAMQSMALMRQRGATTVESSTDEVIRTGSHKLSQARSVQDHGPCKQDSTVVVSVEKLWLHNAVYGVSSAQRKHRRDAKNNVIYNSITSSNNNVSFSPSFRHHRLPSLRK